MFNKQLSQQHHLQQISLSERHQRTSLAYLQTLTYTQLPPS